MGSYAVFLRGINVGGINIKMADLREALKAAFEGNGAALLALSEKRRASLTVSV